MPQFLKSLIPLGSLSLRLLDPGPLVLQTHRPVEYQSAPGRVGVNAEVAEALELVPVARRRAGQGWLDPA